MEELEKKIRENVLNHFHVKLAGISDGDGPLMAAEVERAIGYGVMVSYVGRGVFECWWC